ncbi:MAG: type VI secretion system accessory protein TagJ [Acidobacteriota bacterium]
MSKPKTISLSAKELFDAGQLQAAIETLTLEVKTNPTDNWRRTFLFELLCFKGEWNRAEGQLDVLALQSAKAEIGVQAYRNNIIAERARQRLMSESLQPNFLMPPPAYIDFHLSAIDRIREKQPEQARKLLDRSEQERPKVAGRLNGKKIHNLRDYDDLFAPVLEVFVQEKYTWLPFEQIKRLEIEAPKELRDLLWTRARITTIDAIIGEVFVPVLYPGSSVHPNDLIKLGRMTDWQEVIEGLYVANGMHVYLADNKEKTIFDLKEIEFETKMLKAK